MTSSSSGKRFRPKKNASSEPANIDYTTLQRGHQYFMEGYIPRKHVMFCLKDEIVWIKVLPQSEETCVMHDIKVAITIQLCHVTRAFCSCVVEKLACAAMLLAY